MSSPLHINTIPLTEGVYLLHLPRPISWWHTSQHYIGWSSNLYQRLVVELLGASHAARFCQVAVQKGIPIYIARIWVGETKAFEKELKSRKYGPRICPCCVGQERAQQLILPGFREVEKREIRRKSR